MSTIIYPSPIFGPVHSRRLGISLGINLLPADGKVCSFDCIYCECGFNEDHRPTLPLPTREEVALKLEEKLQTMQTEGQLPDVLTFAGNGEPTCHPHFSEIIADTIRLRDQYCPEAKVSVLSNSTMIHRQQVHDALMRVDNNILKLDTVDPIYINKVDHPNGTYDVKAIIEAVTDEDTANQALATISDLEHALTSKKEAGAMLTNKAKELGLKFDAKARAYVIRDGEAQ